jgi:RNA polymerase sigma factor (TIGR02999 family)
VREPAPLPGLLAQHYRSLRDIAKRVLAQHRLLQKASGPDRVSPSSLVAEATLRMLLQRNPVQNTDHLHGLAALSMRRSLLDRARKRRSNEQARRRADRGTRPNPPADPEGDLTRTLQALRAVHPRQAEVIMLVGLQDLSVADVAARLGVSTATVQRDLRVARAWIAQRLQGD